jgi:multidrug efflux pump subunit AcrA (membrane-fusion protein)
MNDARDQERKRHLLIESGKGLGVLLILLVLMMWLSGTFIQKVEPAPPLAKPPAPRVATRKVEKRTIPLTIDQVGTVRAKTEAQVSSRIMAEVKQVLVREGELVDGSGERRAATIMATLDDREIQARLRQAESRITALDSGLASVKAKSGAAGAQVESSRANKDKVASDYRRYEDLKRNQAATGQQLEHARTQLTMAEAQLQAARKDADAARSEIERIQAEKAQAEAAVAEARVMLTYTTIHAPFTGRVIKKLVNAGDMAAPGQPLFLLDAVSHPELHAVVSESFVHSLTEGEQLDVTVDALSRTFQGALREVVPKSDPSTRTVLVKVSLPPEPGLLNGLFGRLSVPYGEYQALLVPIEAVREVGQLTLVDVVDGEGFPRRRFVTLGPRHGNLVEVLSGLKEDEELVIP